ncbi:MAG: ABC transporter permease [Chloroflexi bacterium]|nr:ABC transporter permease [Chloroflexota bacterium]
MISILRALNAELLKTKRTLTLALAFLAPLALAFLELAVGFQYGRKMYRVGGDTWMTLINHTTMMWVLLLLPLFVTLEMGLLGALEHNNKTWKQLYALPMPRWTIYLAKQIIGMGIIGMSMAVLGLMTVGVGLIGRFWLTDLGFDAPIPWAALVQNLILSYLASWLIISIHLWISLRWSSFVLAMGVGIVATVFGVVVIGSKWEQFDPWTIPGVVSQNLINAESYGLALTIGILGGILVACLGCWDTIRQDVL